MCSPTTECRNNATLSLTTLIPHVWHVLNIAVLPNTLYIQKYLLIWKTFVLLWTVINKVFALAEVHVGHVWKGYVDGEKNMRDMSTRFVWGDAEGSSKIRLI